MTLLAVAVLPLQSSSYGQEDYERMGDVPQGQVSCAVPGETSRLLQEGSCQALPVKYKEMMKSRRVYGISCSEVTPAHLLSSPGR